ncbi:MAG: GIY-YIG nuclease family protein [Thermacetogeniaceae bacterium]|nr:GIY-YIG nuclease family protein [Thermoanaerobacterales bacterium]
MIYYVYILRCGDGSFYTGWTNDLKKRLTAHQEGRGAKYTRGRGPLQLVYTEEFDNKSEAIKREYHIKKMSRKEKETLIDS